MQRDQKRGMINDPVEGGQWQVPEWQVFERDTMFTEVNKWRKERGFDAINMQQLLKVEQFAVGHVDYARKFALYCAKLGCGEAV